jgi:hypothetical protein
MPVLERIDPCFHRRRSARGLLGVHRDPAAHGMDGRHDVAQDIGGKRLVPGPPVGNYLGPPGPLGLRGGDFRQLAVVGPPTPAVKELAVLGDPRPGVHRPRDILVPAEPGWGVPGQAWRPDHRDARGHMLPQILTQDGLVQRLAWSLRTRVGVAVNQARQQPALGHQFGAGHRIGGPPVPVGIEVDRTPIGQRDTANPENGRLGCAGRSHATGLDPPSKLMAVPVM